MKSLVEEKETKMREVMKIMGLRDWVHHLSWFITSFILFFWIAITCTLITTATFLRSSNKSIIFAYFFLFTMSEVTMAFLIAVFFNNSKLASIVGPVILFLTLLPRFIFLSTNSNEASTDKFLASLLSPTAFSLGADIIASYESINIGVQYSNINTGDYSFSDALGLMVLDIFWYGLGAWYFDQVLPTEYGTPRHPLFLFQLSYWCPGLRVKGYNAIKDKAIFNELPEMMTLASGNAVEMGALGNIEQLAVDQRSMVQVRICDLKKRYADGKFAVKGVSVGMLESQITCLLGHNGAGTDVGHLIIASYYEFHFISLLHIRKIHNCIHAHGDAATYVWRLPYLGQEVVYGAA